MVNILSKIFGNQDWNIKSFKPIKSTPVNNYNPMGYVKVNLWQPNEKSYSLNNKFGHASIEVNYDGKTKYFSYAPANSSFICTDAKFNTYEEDVKLFGKESKQFTLYKLRNGTIMGEANKLSENNDVANIKLAYWRKEDEASEKNIAQYSYSLVKYLLSKGDIFKPFRKYVDEETNIYTPLPPYKEFIPTYDYLNSLLEKSVQEEIKKGVHKGNIANPTIVIPKEKPIDKSKYLINSAEFEPLSDIANTTKYFRKISNFTNDSKAIPFAIGDEYIKLKASEYNQLIGLKGYTKCNSKDKYILNLPVNRSLDLFTTYARQSQYYHEVHVTKNLEKVKELIALGAIINSSTIDDIKDEKIKNYIIEQKKRNQEFLVRTFEGKVTQKDLDKIGKIDGIQVNYRVDDETSQHDYELFLKTYPKYQNINVNTPLINAAINSDEKLVEVLLKHGASPQMVNKEKYTAENICYQLSKSGKNDFEKINNLLNSYNHIHNVWGVFESKPKPFFRKKNAIIFGVSITTALSLGLLLLGTGVIGPLLAGLLIPGMALAEVGIAKFIPWVRKFTGVIDKPKVDVKKFERIQTSANQNMRRNVLNKPDHSKEISK